MKKLFWTTALIAAFFIQTPAFSIDSETLASIGFHKRISDTAQQQIKNIFDKYQKYSNNHNLDGFLLLHDESYRSSDGYDKNKLKELIQESWKEYPNVKNDIRVLSVDVDIDNATVITKENLCGNTNANVDYVKGTGYLESEATSIYYLKRFSNEWRITSDFIVTEKTSMKYGVAKFVPMSIDAPAIVSPGEEYTAVLKAAMPRAYVALISINNEPITFPIQRSKEVFRAIKDDGIKERILISNTDSKNENAIASVGIAKPSFKKDSINVSLEGIAFLSTRVNVVKHKIIIPQPSEKEVKSEIVETNNKDK